MKQKISSNQDMQKMQQDAIRRVREMQARAKHALETVKIPCEDSKNKINLKNPQNKAQKEHLMTAPKSSEAETQDFSINHKKINTPKSGNINIKNISSILSSLSKDQEKVLILILILVLTGEDDSLGVILVLASLIL